MDHHQSTVDTGARRRATPFCRLYRYVCHHTVWFLSTLGLKLVIDFYHLCLKSCMFCTLCVTRVWNWVWFCCYSSLGNFVQVWTGQGFQQAYCTLPFEFVRSSPPQALVSTETFPYMKRSFVRNIILFSYQWFPRSIIIFACVTYVADFYWKYFPSKWHVPLESLVQFK